MKRFFMATATSLALISTVEAGAYLNTIDDTAVMYPSAQKIAIGGPIGCPTGQAIEVHVSVSQNGKAVGDGDFGAQCSGEQSRWSAVVDIWGVAPEQGDAEAHAWATVFDNNGTVRHWDWGKNIVLETASGSE